MKTNRSHKSAGKLLAGIGYKLGHPMFARAVAYQKRGESAKHAIRHAAAYVYAGDTPKDIQELIESVS